MSPTHIHDVPATQPHLIAPDTWLIPNLAPAGDGLYLPVNSMVIRGRQPVIIDTGAPVHRTLWLEKVFSVVEPEDVRWIFLSHDDGDHTGALFDVLERCRNATLVTNFFSVERLALEKPALPLERMRWIEPGGSFDAGDRMLQLFRAADLRRPDVTRPVRPEDGHDVDRRLVCLLHAGLARRRRPAAGSAGAGDAGPEQRRVAVARLAGPRGLRAPCRCGRVVRRAHRGLGPWAGAARQPAGRCVRPAARPGRRTDHSDTGPGAARHAHRLDAGGGHGLSVDPSVDRIAAPRRRIAAAAFSQGGTGGPDGLEAAGALGRDAPPSHVALAKRHSAFLLRRQSWRSSQGGLTLSPRRTRAEISPASTRALRSGAASFPTCTLGVGRRSW